MRGIPKFLLPMSSDTTLIEFHIRSALQAGYDQIYVTSQALYVPILKKQLIGASERIEIISLSSATSTMCETLLESNIDTAQFSRITVGLADTAYLGPDAGRVYRNLAASDESVNLALFKMRTDQMGKLGQVALDFSGKVTHIIDKDPNCAYPWIWGVADFKSDLFSNIDKSEAHIGISIERWMSEGITVAGVANDAQYYDCGTFNEYASYIQSIANA